MALAFFSLVPAAFGIGNFEWSVLGESLAVGATMLWAFDTMGRLFSLGKRPVYGILGYMSAFASCMVFNGLMVRTSDVIWPFRLLSFVDPMKYGFRTLVFLSFRDAIYNGTVPCTPSETCAVGFTCPGIDSIACYGESGAQITNTLHANYDAISADVRWTDDMGYILAFGAVFQLLHTLLLLYLCSRAASIETHAGADITARAQPQPAPCAAGGNGLGHLPGVAIGANENQALHDATTSEPSPGAEAGGGVELTFADCNYVVRVGTNAFGCGGSERTLLHRCSARVAAGEILAIMGPSGAGKTTLLSELTLTDAGGVARGTVTLNGHEFTASMYKAYAAYVPQEDQLWAFLSAREHLECALALHQPQWDAARRTTSVDELLQELGLVDAQHTRAGSALFKGLSGGQRRRLSLGVALTKQPLVVFLDEPSSGLDAAAAASIMHFLKRTVARLRIVMVCTIHQPSSSVYAGFGSVLYLSGGEVAYLGEASELPTYLASVGRPLPPHANPADWMLDLINRDFSDDATVDSMLSQWRGRCSPVATPAPSTLPAARHTPFGKQLATLYARHFRLIVRDPTLYSARLVMTVICTSFISIIFLQSRDTVQEQVRAASWRACEHVA